MVCAALLTLPLLCPRYPGVDAAYGAALPATYVKFDMYLKVWLYHVPNEMDWSCGADWAAQYLADTEAQGATRQHTMDIDTCMCALSRMLVLMYYMLRIFVHIPHLGYLSVLCTYGYSHVCDKLDT